MYFPIKPHKLDKWSFCWQVICSISPLQLPMVVLSVHRCVKIALIAILKLWYLIILKRLYCSHSIVCRCTVCICICNPHNMYDYVLPLLTKYTVHVQYGTKQVCHAFSSDWCMGLSYKHSMVHFLSNVRHIIWARHEKTCLRWVANNTGADQPAHPCSLISTFVIH